MSGHSKSKIERIKNYWLNREPTQECIDLSKYKYVLFDGTYFHKNGCLICLKDSISHRIIGSIYATRESYEIVHPWFKELRAQGLVMQYIAMDGERSIMRAVKDVWPQCKIQRCLYHIQREGMRWLRTYPKTLAGQQLRRLLSTLSAMRTVHDKELFVARFKAWHKEHYAHIRSLPSSTIAYRDLKKTMTLIENALPDMFRFLNTSIYHQQRIL